MNTRALWLMCLLLGAPTAVGAQSAPSRFDTALARYAAQGGDPTPWQLWLNGEEAAVRQWASRQRDNASWVGGWPHDHADVQSGRHLVWNTETPRPPPALNGGKLVSGWTAINREHNLRQVLGAARLAYWLDRPELARWAANELDTYAELYATQPVRGTKERSVLFTESLQEAVVLPSVLEAIRLLGEAAGEEQAQRWRDALVAPMVANLMASQHEVSNKSVWRTAAVALAAEQYDRADWRHFVSSGAWSFERQMATALPPDGYWFELSLQYQGYVLRALAEYAVGMRNLGAQARTDVHAQAALLAMTEALMRMRYPNGEAPLINDSQPGRQVPTIDLHALLQQAWPALPVVAGMATPPPGWTTWATRVLDPVAPSPPALSAFADGAVRLAGLHAYQFQQGPWRALLRAGQGARFHAHQDALSVELMYRDEWVWRNAGTEAYGTRQHLAYQRKAAAHTGPLVNDVGALNWFARPSKLPETPTSAAATFADFRHDTTVSRRLSGTTEVLMDELVFASKVSAVTHGSMFHTPCVLQLLPSTSAKEPRPPSPTSPDVEALGFMKLRYWGRINSTWRLGLQCGVHRLLVDFTPFTTAEVWLGNSPGGPVGGPARTAIYLRMSGATHTHLQVRVSADRDTP